MRAALGAGPWGGAFLYLRIAAVPCSVGIHTTMVHSDGGIMQQRHASAVFIIGWVSFISFITWLDWHNVFFYFPYLPTVVFFLFPCLSLFALWKEEPSPKDCANLVTGLMWLIRVSLTAPTKGRSPALVWIALVQLGGNPFLITSSTDDPYTSI
jgi:hypothetical protein